MRDLDLYNGPRSIVNIPIIIETPYATSYVMAIVMFAWTVTIFEILAVEMCMSLTLTLWTPEDGLPTLRKLPYFARSR